MNPNPDYIRSLEERNNEGFFKVLQSVDVSSENMRAFPLDFAQSLPDNDLSRKMKIETKWGRSWEVGISKNPRFYFMDKSGWLKFVKDNALGHSEFLTFIHKGEMRFTVNIFKEDGKEMMQPPQSRDFMASARRFRTEQQEDYKTEEVFVSSGFSNRVPRTAAELNERGKYKGKKRAEDKPNLKRTEKVVNARRYSEKGASSSSAAGFNIIFNKAYLIFVRLPQVGKDLMPVGKTAFKIHHPNGKKSWNVVYLLKFGSLSGGWRRVVKEYPLVFGDTCKFSFIKPDELLLVVSKPEEETH